MWQCDNVVPLRFRMPLLAREVPQCDIVVVSHAHEDHGAAKTLRVLGRQTNAHFCGPLEMKQKFLDVGISEDRIHVALPGQIRTVAGMNVEWAYAVHGPPTYAAGYLMDDGENRVYYTGDNSTIEKHPDFPHIMEFRDIDLLILPAPLQYMGGERGAKLANAIDASFVLPSHFNTYDIPDENLSGGWLGGDPEAMRPHMKHPERLIRPLQGQGLHIAGGEGKLIMNPNPRQLKEQAWPAYGEIKIDGDLLDWQRARWTIKLRPRILTPWGTDTARCAVLWDEDNLYVAFDVKDTDMQAGVQDRDANVFADDCVEVNIDPHGERPEQMEKNDYYYTITVGNVVSDASGPREDKTWNSKFRHAVSLRGSLNNSEDGTAATAWNWRSPGRNLASGRMPD